MTPEDLMNKLMDSSNQVLKAQSHDAAWIKLRHNRDDLEVFLRHNITHLKFKTADGKTDKTIVACSNPALVRLFQAKSGKPVANRISQRPRSTRSKRDNVLTYDFATDNWCTIPMVDWTIYEFVTVKDENVPIINDILRRILGLDDSNRA